MKKPKMGAPRRPMDAPEAARAVQAADRLKVCVVFHVNRAQPVRLWLAKQLCWAMVRLTGGAAEFEADTTDGMPPW